MRTQDTLLRQLERVQLLPQSLAVWGLGQMGLIVKGPDAVVMIDPCLSDIITPRAFPPPVQPERLTQIDFVLVSHDHIDHLDPQTLRPLAQASPRASFITSGWNVDALREAGIAHDRLVVLTRPITLGSMTLSPVAAAHPHVEYDAERGYRWMGFHLQWNGVTLYFAGDTAPYTGWIESLRAFSTIDLAMLPVNGRDWFRENKDDLLGNLLPIEAARLAKEMEWRLTLAGHNDLYPPNTIPMGEIAQAFADHAPGVPYKVLQPGELLYFVK